MWLRSPHQVCSLFLSHTLSLPLALCARVLQVAVAMADPFGEDDVDFDVDSLLQDAYKDTLAALRDTRAPLGNTATTRTNPLDAAQPTPAKVRTFSDSPANMEAPAEESPWWVAMWRVPWAAPKKASREIL